MASIVRAYCPRGFRIIESPARTALRITDDRDLSIAGIGPDVEETLLAHAAQLRADMAKEGERP